jgi:tetratricopeptide (TPR) repeat protein
MTEPRRFPFGGVPVYNPQSLSKGEALAQFHARQAAYQSLMDLLREERPSHVLIIGTRGMGKTTLLQRVHYGVEDDAELNGRYLVLAFPEEQYNVNRLHHFLLNAVDALADAMERLQNDRMQERVEAQAKLLAKLGQEEIEQRAPKFLAEVGQEMRRSFLLLVDNADRLFDTIEDNEQWRLRELLSTRRDLTLFGATTQASDGIYGTERAFFEFFKIHRLTPLTLEEVRNLLLQLSESVEEREGEKGAAKRRVEEWLAADAARLRTLVQLTGGNPRTTVLLFHLVLDGLTGGAREYLEQLLDQSTPNYKGRVDELPAQAQQVLDAVALRWDPVTAIEVAEDTGLERSAVSTQLTRLVRQGLLEKADPGDSTKALYQVAERFFNIWYLMRASRRVRAKLRWFVEFLRVFFDSGELERMAWERVGKFQTAGRTRPAEIETAFAYFLASGADHNRFEDYLRRECADMEPEWRPFLQAVRSQERDHVEREIVETRSPTDIERLRRAVEIEPGSAENWRRLGHALFQREEFNSEAEAALRKAIELDPKHALAWGRLGELLRMRARGEEGEAALRKAIDLNPRYASAWGSLGALLGETLERREEAEVALRKAIELAPKYAWAWHRLGELLRRMRDRREEAETALRKAIELSPKYAWAWGSLGSHLVGTLDRREEAEAALRKAIELAPKHSLAWGRLGELLRMRDRREDGEAALRKAIDLNPRYASAWGSLGELLGETLERREEAEEALRKAIELAPKYARAWGSLGALLGETLERREEAEAALRKAIELDPKYAWAWGGLGELLGEMPERREEAEVAFRKAAELDPNNAWFWANLGNILGTMPGRLDEAEAAFSKALEADPLNGNIWGLFGVFLACRAGKPRQAAVTLRKSAELEPDNSRNLRNLGVLLYCETLEEKEAVQYLGRASQLELSDPVSAAILSACVRGSKAEDNQPPIFIDGYHEAEFWDELLDLCHNYPPFGKILIGICDAVQKRDSSNALAYLHRAVALAQLGDFPRASVALEDALDGDPIEMLSAGRKALEVFFAAAVRSGRVRDCLELLDKKEWKDAWRPIYEALKSVEAGSGEYLKRVAVEIREPAMQILRRIAPELPGTSGRTN